MRRNRERGQAAVEFAIFAVILILLMFLIVQLMWIGVQKWQFNHFALYSARVWSVRQDWGSENSLIRVQAGSIASDWNLMNKDWVKFMAAYSEDPQDVDDDNKDIKGISYVGVAPLFSLYKSVLGETAFDSPVPDWIMSALPFGIPTSGYVSFMSFIPMEREPAEEPDTSNRDNDCDDTPCSSGNGR